MIPANAAVSQIQAYLRSQDVQQLVQAVDAIQDIAPLFTVGERLHAEVTSQLPNGRFAVLVKDQLLDLNLPRNTQPGEQLDLEVLAQQPRLTFLLQGRTAPTGTDKLPLPLPAAAPTVVRPETERVDLSKTGQLIESLLSDPAVPDDPARPRLAGAVNAPALVGAGTLDPAKLAQALKEALSTSGLFYESHQADWMEGKRDLAALLKEPQAAFSRLLSNPASVGLSPNLAPALPGDAGAEAPDGAEARLLAAALAAGLGETETPGNLASTASPAANRSPLPADAAALIAARAAGVADAADERASRLQGQAGAQGDRRQDGLATTTAVATDAASLAALGKSGSMEEIPGAIRQLVQQQLESLDRRQVSWTGQVWPGQTMQWDIEEDGGRNGRQAEANPSATVWRSRLQLDLPSLGPVNALVTLTGKQQVDVRFSVVVPDTAQRIRDHQQKLDNALQAAGLQLTSNLVAVDAQEPPHGE